MNMAQNLGYEINCQKFNTVLMQYKSTTLANFLVINFFIKTVIQLSALIWRGINSLKNINNFQSEIISAISLL